MDGFVIVGGGLFFVTSSIMGVRLLVLASRNRGFPELVLGLAFLLGGTLGGALGQYVLVRADAHPPATLGVIILVYLLAGVSGMALYNTFTWRVFRPDARWAGVLVAIILAGGLALVPWYAATGVFQTGIQTPTQRAVICLANAAGPIWATVEATVYWARMRRRLALGLAEPIVVNRFLLWAIGAACASVIVLSSISLVFVDPSHPAAQASLLCVGFLGTLASGVYALAFFPPRGYLAWLRADA